MGKTEQQPFSSFGLALKRLRRSHSKSCVEVSGAVEINEQLLKDFEAGIIRPTEDILLLLIQHFNLQHSAAKELWRLAGYGELKEGSHYFINEDNNDHPQSKTVMVTPQDARIVYTDLVQVMVNNYGVIVNFMQGAGVNNQPLAVSRVGMSREHAKSVIEVLTKTLEQADNLQNTSKPKQLPANTLEQQD